MTALQLLNKIKDLLEEKKTKASATEVYEMVDKYLNPGWPTRPPMPSPKDEPNAEG